MTTQTPIDPKFVPAHQRPPRVEVYWKAVTYKTVIVYVLLALTIIFAGIFIAKPDLYQVVLKKVSRAVSDPENETQGSDQKHAKFVNLDGRVQVKKVNSVQWVEADYRTSLDKGDLVQTGSDANARITFADGTTYTVKPDTLVTVGLFNAKLEFPRLQGRSQRGRCARPIAFQQPCSGQVRSWDEGKRDRSFKRQRAGTTRRREN